MLSSITKVVVVPFEVNKQAQSIVSSVSKLAVLYYDSIESVWCVNIATNDEKLATSIHNEIQEALFNAQKDVNSHHASVSKNEDDATCVGCYLTRKSCDNTNEEEWGKVLDEVNKSYDIFHLLNYIKEHGVSNNELIRLRMLDMLYFTVDPNNTQDGIFPVHYEDLCRFSPRFAKAYPMNNIVNLAVAAGIDGRSFVKSLNTAVKNGWLTEEQAKIVRYAYS